MSSHEHDKPLDDLRKASEEEYFRKQNAALAAKLKQRQELENAGIQDPQLVDQLLKAGLTSGIVKALYWVPLIEVAWADGEVQEEEKEEILNILKAQGLKT